MSYFDPNDFISCQAWEKLCESGFDRKSIPAEGIVYCPLEYIHEFFSMCSQTTNRYVLVSACSDYGLHEQDIDHPNADIWKQARRINFEAIGKRREGYFYQNLGPTCDTRNCNPADKYSVKYYNWTNSTFTAIPPNVVRWFCTNVNIEHPLIEAIPFGVNDEGNVVEGFLKRQGRPKRGGLLYVNFQPHTWERLDLLTYYGERQKHYGGAHITVQKNVPVDEFWDAIAEHHFVLCPFGNGLDCYRTWETLYLGSIPVIQSDVFARHFSTYPVAVVDNLFDMNEDILQKGLDKLRSTEQEYNAMPLKLSYWKKRLDFWRSRL